MLKSNEMPQKKEQVVELNFMGQRCVLKNQGDPETIREVVDLVTLRLADVERRTRGLAAHQVALLALLDIGEEYVKAKKRTQDHKRRVEKQAGELRRLIDQPLK